MAQIELQLTLPRDAQYVGVLRRVADSLLRGLNVPDESVDDVAVALSEACGNVIRHAEGTNEYGVQLSVDAHQCSIEVCDLGPGFDAEALAEDAAPLDEVAAAEDGRGLPLLQALMDDLEFVREEDTTTVRLVKRWEAVGLERGAVEA
ncbi:MAG TPA: ATP-binding protein [Euzebyales bacterium]|nr:ATP-binding protein [Euzebyales bacterium]